MMLDSSSEKRFGRRLFQAFEATTPATAERVCLLRREMGRAGYDEGRVCALLGLSDLQALDPVHFHYYDRWILPQTPLADLIRLFLLDLSLSRPALEAALPAGAVELLVEMGVLVPLGERWHSQVHLFCFQGLLLATDTGRYSPLWPEGEDLPDRVMYLGYDSVGLACVAPRSPSRRTLDLCCGGGIQALVAAHYSEEVIGVDLNPRAVRFARFNAALNDIRNARFVEGDLFEPVHGVTFDRILANPPFVPQPDSAPRLLYRDGGPTGESLLCRILREGPSLLNEHATLAITTDLINLDGLEERIRRWGEGAAPAADVLVFVERALPIAAYAQGHSVHLQTEREREAHRCSLLDHLQSAGISSIHSGYIVLRRLPAGAHGSYRILDTVKEVSRPAHAHVEEYFRCREAMRGQKVERTRVQLSPGVRFRIALASEGGEEHQRIELVWTEDVFFPPLEISETVHHLLRYIQKNRPRWSELATEKSQPLLEDLLQRGVLQLVSKK